MSSFARHLRRNMTDAERLLWRHLRARRLGGYRFRRQHPIGPYVVDFACMRAGVVVELDGGQHGERAHAAHDARRSAHLARAGYRVLRFWNHEVLAETEAVLAAILRALQAPVD